MQTIICVVLLSMTLMFNKIGMLSSAKKLIANDEISDEELCPIGVSDWYILLTSVYGLKLVCTVVRYLLYKNNREESIPAFAMDLLLVNALVTGVFIRANQMYFSRHNYCTYMQEPLNIVSYHTFCTFVILGYLQFIYCILISCYVPLIGFIIYQLVKHRLS